MENPFEPHGLAAPASGDDPIDWRPLLFGWLCLVAASGFGVWSRVGADAIADGVAVAESTRARPPSTSSPHRIIDMHLHAIPADFNGTPPIRFCAAELVFPGIDPRNPFGLDDVHDCPEPLISAFDDAELRERTIDVLERYDMLAVASGPIEQLNIWRAAAPDRIIPALLFMVSSRVTPADFRALVERGDVAVLGEVMTQYEGLSPGDAALDPYLSIAEELDVPVAFHMGMGPPGAAYLRSPKFRASLTSPLLLEPALLRHPRLRVSVMHAGWPMLDEILHLLYSHPQVYVDVGIISWGLPRAEFHRYLRTLVEAGFGKRIMFGSDQVIWPDAIGIAIDAIDTAEFLTEAQRRDIFYNNAARFLRLEETQEGPR